MAVAAGEGSAINNNMQQQQPSGPSSPLTPSPKYGEAQSNNLSQTPMSTTSTHSPGGTPYRFKDFPASLPKVNHNRERSQDNVDERKQPPGTAQKLNLLPKPTPRKPQQDYNEKINPQSSRRLFMQQQTCCARQRIKMPMNSQMYPLLPHL